MSMPPLQMRCFPHPHGPHPLTPSPPACLFSFCQTPHLCLPSHMPSLTCLFPHMALPSRIFSHTSHPSCIPSLAHLFPCASLALCVSSLAHLFPHVACPSHISSLTWSLPSHGLSLTHLVSSLAFVIPILAWMPDVIATAQLSLV